MEEWIAQELERTELGDERRTKRLIKIVSNLSALAGGDYTRSQRHMGRNQGDL